MPSKVSKSRKTTLSKETLVEEILRLFWTEMREMAPAERGARLNAALAYLKERNRGSPLSSSRIFISRSPK